MNELGDNVPAIVHKVSLGESLPGIEALCKSTEKFLANAKKSSSESRLNRIEAALMIYEYASREDVKLKVQMINIDPATGKKKEGRPKQAHRLAMQVVAQKCGVGERCLDKWVTYALDVCAALELIESDEGGNKRPVKNAHSEFMALVPETQDDIFNWFETMPFLPPPPPVIKQLTPEQIAQAIKGVFNEHFYTEKGILKLAKDERAQVVHALNPVLKQIGFKINPIGQEN